VKRRWAIVGGTLVALSASAWLVLRSHWLMDQVRARAVAELERATGAEVEMGALRVDWFALRAEATSLSLRTAGGAPFFRSGSVRLERGWRSGYRLAIDGPRVDVRINADGSNNLPRPRGSGSVARLFDLTLDSLTLRDGELRWNDRRTPLDFEARDVKLSAVRDGLRYRGELGLTAIAPEAATLETKWELTRERAGFHELKIGARGIEVRGSAAIREWDRPAWDADLELRADVARFFGDARGTVEGALRLAGREGDWRAEGDIEGKNLNYREVRGASAAAHVVADRRGAELSRVRAALLGGEFAGEANVSWPSRFRASGKITGVRVPHPQIASRATGDLSLRNSPWRVEAKLALEAEPGPIPLSGGVDLRYDASAGEIEFGPSSLATGETRVNASGALSRGLDLRIHTRAPDDLLPALRLTMKNPPQAWPFELRGGELEAVGKLQGSLDAPNIEARLDATRAFVAGQLLDRFSTELSASPSRLELRRTRAVVDGVAVEAEGSASLSNWRLAESDAIATRASVRDLNLARLKLGRPVAGRLSGTARVSGTWGAPEARGEAVVERPEIGGQRFDRASASFAAKGEEIDLTGVEVRSGTSRVHGKATVGRMRRVAFEVETPGWALGWATVSGRAAGVARKEGERWTVASLGGELRAATPEGIAGVATITSSEGELRAKGGVALTGSRASFDTRWTMDGEMPGEGTVQLDRLTSPAIEKITGAKMPFDALVEGRATISGRLLAPQTIAVRARLATLRLAPLEGNAVAGLSAADLTLANDGEISLTASASGIAVERARLVAKDTRVDVLGGVVYARPNAWNLLARGSVNLAVLGTFRPGLISSGVSMASARIRGPLREPQIDGRLELRDASFYLRDVANGLDKVNGTVAFDRSRATVDSLTAETGGGKASLSGFIGFSGDLNYQLQATLDRVRVRYPEGLSTQVNAGVTLTGGPRRGLLAGTVTILRAALAPGADVGGILARPTQPIAAAPSNDFLRNLQFDVRVETAQSAEFSTELTREVQADIDVRLRGTPVRPSLQGRVSITQGRIQFFGTDYTINRGEIDFVNASRLDPRIDLDLETRVRGIAVSISFTGPMSRVNMAYRSDPPLQSSEILALLAVGRAPAANSGVAGAPRPQDLLSAGGNAILDSAMSAPSSGRLQRFFGVTRLKIDPQLIGLDNTPQARLTLEQQVSRDVTVTYVTSLNRAQTQIARVEWDLSRRFSAVMTRDENGVLSLDFFYKRGFR